MVQINTSGVKAAEKPPEEDPGEVEFFTYEGPKISFAASLGTSNAMSLYGFKAVTESKSLTLIQELTLSSRLCTSPPP